MMKLGTAFALVALLASGCATQMVEKNAKDSCAAEGKKAFIVDLKQSGIPLFLESASATALCVGPDDITHLPANFGADAVSASNLHGAGIFAVTPGLVADKAGLKAEDIVYEFAGRSIALATDLRVAVDSMSPGDQALIKLRRNGGRDLTVTAHFISAGTIRTGPTPAPYVSKLSLNLPAGYTSQPVPEIWVKGGALVYAVNRNNNVAVMLSAKSRDAIRDVAAYAQSRQAGVIAASKGGQVSELSQLEVDGKREFRFTFVNTESNGETYINLITIIEGPTEVATLSAWTYPPNYDRQKGEMAHLSDQVIGF
jgi:hypothetical protein